MSEHGTVEYRIGQLERDLKAESGFTGCLWLAVFLMAVAFAIFYMQYDEHLRSIGHPLNESTWQYFKRKLTINPEEQK